jgi:lysophospholipase L1-like esterase
MVIMSKESAQNISLRRRVWFSVTLVVIIFLSIAGVGELIVRLLSPGGHVTPDTMRENSLEYQPSVFARSVYPQRAQQAENGRVHINKLGYRGNDFSIDKKDGVTRIICLGGSQVLDGAQEERKNWPALLEAKLQAKGINAEVINAGVAGNASCDSLGRLYTEIWMLKPDYIVVCHAWNDLKYFKSLVPAKSILRTIHTPQFIMQNGEQLVWNPYIYYTGGLDRFMCHSQLYVRLRNRYWSLKLGIIGFEGLLTGNIKVSESSNAAGGEKTEKWSNEWAVGQYALNMQLIVTAAKAIGAVPVLLTQPRLAVPNTTAVQRKRIGYGYIGLSHNELVDAFDECDRVLINLAAKEQVQLIDTRDALTGKPGLFRDHVHLSAEGSEVLAELVARAWK